MNKILLIFILISISTLSFAQSETPIDKYLAFQVFTDVSKSEELRKSFPPMHSLKKTVQNIVSTIGKVGEGNHHLGFIVGPLSFDQTDDEIQSRIHDAFQIAVTENIAVGFHIDDSMFWGRLKNLNTKDNVEWLDWQGTLNSGRRLDWSSNPIKIMPQLCLNSPAVRDAVKQRAELIGTEIKAEIEALKSAHKEYLFIGIISGWETQIGKDNDTNQSLGYCALTHRGFSAQNPPSNKDKELESVVREFIDFWAKIIVDAGVPAEKIYSHTAFMTRTSYTQLKIVAPDRINQSYSEMTNFTPVDVSFGDYYRPGFTTYPQIAQLEEIKIALESHKSLFWASCEGSAIDPALAEHGTGPGNDMELYLGNRFNHGAVLVNIFGWGVGDANNRFRTTVENKNAIAAYQKFLSGQPLSESPSIVQPPSEHFLKKILELQQELDPYIKKHGSSEIQKLYNQLNSSLTFGQFKDAETVVDQILKKIH